MLIPKPQVNIIARVVELATGELVRAYFVVVTTQGVPEVKFLGFKPIEDEVCVALLTGQTASCFGESSLPVLNSTSSPFLKNFDFLINQLARAPSQA